MKLSGTEVSFTCPVARNMYMKLLRTSASRSSRERLGVYEKKIEESEKAGRSRHLDWENHSQ